MVNVNIISYKTKKLSPVEIITKYNLNKEYIWKKIDILKDTNSLAYNI